MADVDTSAEAVERQAVSADEVWADFLYLMGRASTEGHAAGQRLACEARIKLQHTAATLRALAAENAALRAERDAARRLAVAGDDLLRECRAVLEPLIAERDTAQADARRLRALLGRADRELEMIRMKDCDAVYDTLIRVEMAAALAQGGAE